MKRKQILQQVFEENKNNATPLEPTQLFNVLMAMDRFGNAEYSKGLIDGEKGDLFKIVAATGQNIADDRSQYDVLTSTMEEVGEMALELRIKAGQSYKPQGDDGVIGEAIDSISCLMDIIWLENPNITSEDLAKIMITKCKKWANKSKDRGVWIGE